MKALHISYMALALTSSHQAFANTDLVRAEIPNCNYTKLVVNAPSKIKLIAQGQPSGSVQGTSKELGYLKYKCSDGILEIDTKRNVSIRKGYSFNLANGSISKVILNGNQQANISELVTKEFSLASYGSAKSVISGKVEYFNVTADGEANVDSSTLESQKGKVWLNGSGSVKINSSEELSAEVNGSGRIEYIGTPKQLDVSFNGTGSISTIN
ncbi:GIN domain-containing protein [Vibrio penaeicida]|uniref:GIN domain-containing protein n=1 Tax=Vibrio penaeicida TaxID=104609 RepID=UPI000CEA4B64|nr:DUF2807 domain-containing protein [Vibrio penaeicida]